MALKLGKCRLCLKLGDFYSIFTVDNSMQLAEMAMECARIKNNANEFTELFVVDTESSSAIIIYDGDGLPDKVCSECIQKLSSAHIFKQQCERADQELRRNYVPPPGFSVTPSPNRQSSDSAFSNHTDLSAKPSSSTERKSTPASRARKRSLESDASARSRDNSFRGSASKPREEKRSRVESENTSARESDYENDDSTANYSEEGDEGDSDSNEPLLKNDRTCQQCGRVFPSKKGMLIHTKRAHSNLRENEVVSIPVDNTKTEEKEKDEEGQSCDKCGRTFKLKIMLKRHYDTCNVKSDTSPKKELLVTLEPLNPEKKIDCQMCSTKFKNIENLEKHMRMCHAAVLNKRTSGEKPPEQNKKVPVPCIFCNKHFDDYYVHAVHFNSCNKAVNLTTFECKVCKKVFGRKNAYFLHIKNIHFEPRHGQAAKPGAGGSFECRMCSKKMATQEALITHLAAHVSHIDEPGSVDEESRASTIDDSTSQHSEQSASASGPLACKFCDKRFSYKKALESHENKHIQEGAEIKTEPPDPEKNPNISSTNLSKYRDTDSEDSSGEEDGEGDNTCHICEKMFSYKRALVHHKRTKHNMSSGTKRAPVLAKNCKVQCLICDLEMTVSSYKEHNKKHIAENIKPRNLYTCSACGETSMSLQGLGTHIKLVHRLKQQSPKRMLMPNPADFCEVVVTKSEPLEAIQSHNGVDEVPAESPGGFACPHCNKMMGTLLSLKRHLNWHTNVGDGLEQQIECFVCQEKFRFKGHFRRHMKHHYSDTTLDPKFLTCTICNRRSKHLRAAQAHMNFHKQTRFKANDYECSICKRVFQFRKVYLSHMGIHYKRGETIKNTVVGDAAKKDGQNLDNTCPLCNKVCDNEVSLKHHMAFHKSKSSLFGDRHQCPFCELQFTNKRSKELHLRTHFEDDNGPYKCNICGKGYTDEEYFRKHLKGHNFDHTNHQKRLAKLRENKVKCPICTKYYPNLAKLIGHLRRTHPESKMIKVDPDAPPEKIYPCKLCAKVFRNEKRFKFHEEAHLRRPEFFKCKFCGKKTLSLKNHNIHVKGHLTRKHVDNPLKCPQCDEHFIRGYDLHYHLRDVHNVVETWIADRTQQTLNGPLKHLQCSICMKVLASQGNYERHIDYHNTLRCNYCFDFFSALRFLEGHLAFSCEKKKLIGETEVYPRKIKCHVCYKAFHLQVKLDCHLRTQHDINTSKEAGEGKKEIICDYCFKVFENEYALQTHKLYHRTIGYYGCLYCEKKFNTLVNYRKHKTHHTSQLNVDNPTKCEHCDETFVPFREFIYHMKEVHGDDKEWIVYPKESIEEECPICKKVFFNLHKHLRYHEENRCKKCGEYFYSTIDFDNHLCDIDSEGEAETFAVEQPKYEECRFCFKPLTNSNSKLKHDLIHKGSGSISCRFCKLKFKTLDAFNIHSFSHRSRKYKKKPIKCRQCGEKFIQYGPFMKHMKLVHKSKNKLHYRAIVKPETCVVCGDDFPNLHNHYRAHLLNQCQSCGKYFTSAKVFTQHKCDKEDSDPTKVFTSDANLMALINSYVPKDERDNEKYYGMSDDEEEEEEKDEEEITSTVVDSKVEPGTFVNRDDSQISTEMEPLMPLSIQSPIISEVLSLYQDNDCEIIDIGDDDNPYDSGKVIDLVDDDSRD